MPSVSTPTSSEVFEKAEEPDKAAAIINRYIRTRRVEFPEDLAALIEEIGFELGTSVEACHRADFFIKEKNDKSKAQALMNDVVNHVNTFKRQIDFLLSQADYCLQGIKGTRNLSSFNHNPSKKKLSLLPPEEIMKCLSGFESESDFAGWRLEKKTGGWFLTITTQRIKIEDPRYDVVNDFGQFEIVLSMSELARGVRKPYKLYPLQPNYPRGGSSGSTPHPHVQNNLLCEGDGEGMIMKSLQVGDMLSFGILVSQILLTYNPDSPYTVLDEWSKQLPQGPNPRRNASFDTGSGDDEAVCSDCGDEYDSYDLHTCRSCGASVCEECSSMCSSFNDRTLCARCVRTMRDNNTRCEGCSIETWGTRGCLLGRRESCRDCGSRLRRDSSDLRTCSQGYVCVGCLSVRTTERRPCCDRWADRDVCAYRDLLNNDGPDAERVGERPAEAFNIEAAADDGIGGFGPPTTS